MNLFGIRGLYKCYRPEKSPPIYAVRDFNLDIRRGEIVGLVGESGCGKSTLGKLLLKLENATRGRVVFDGRDITRLSYGEMRAVRRRMQMVFQDSANAFNPYFTVRDIIGEPLRNYGADTPAERDGKIVAMLERVGLDAEYLTRRPSEMSGGQRQRVGIARALILRPEFVVCDEAVSSVDYALKNKILSLIAGLKAEFGLTYLFISHDIAAVNKICDRVVVMYLGNIVEILPSVDGGAAHPYTRALIAATLIPDPTRRKENLATLLEDDGENLRIPARGCVLQNRCPRAAAICRDEEPPLVGRAGSRYAACHFF
jgi:peptide/nickel transport system ATP-binding protein/oligopeptide transport system ATP-binding protein